MKNSILGLDKLIYLVLLVVLAVPVQAFIYPFQQLPIQYQTEQVDSPSSTQSKASYYFRAQKQKTRVDKGYYISHSLHLFHFNANETSAFKNLQNLFPSIEHSSSVFLKWYHNNKDEIDLC